MEEQKTGDEESGGGPGFDLEIVRSYLSFAKHAITSRRIVIGVLLVLGLTLTGLVVKFIPRTYSCTTVLMTVENAVLDVSSGGRPLVGAEGLLMRHENLESLVRSTGLVKNYYPRRPPLLRLKDRISQGLFGMPDEKTIVAILVGTLENRLFVETKDDTLEIRVDWSDPETTSELAEAAKQSFLRIRHRTEISAFQEKMGILDTHAAKLREEIDSLAAQMKEALAAKAAEVTKAGGTAAKTGAAVSLSPSVRPRRPVGDDMLPELREKLASQKQKLASMEEQRNARVNTERAKLEELKVRFTPSHPQVIMQEERLGIASNVPSEMALLRAEVGDLEMQIRQRDSMSKTGTTSGGRSSASTAAAATAELLPGDILRLLEEEDVDPALSAQMSGAVTRYGALRDEVRGAKLALDTAQAAFNHRYQVVIPVETPKRALKPAIPVVAGAGIFLSLLLAFLVPILLELRRGVLAERWQVDHFQLPVLAELRLPERTEQR